ncbi:MAG: hypothetical protein NUV80_04455 [Candidatus Berkelbacteria bacterium]|nr:hypothetical protein [Candidatus Berkelbacteria bacterium]
MAYEDVAQRVKKKYPGVYDNIPDSELGDKIIAKYPQYAQMGVQPTEQSTEQPTKKGGVLKSIAGFLGVKNLGTGAAQVLATPGAVRTSENISSQNADSVQRLIKRIQGEKDPNKKAAFRKILNRFIKETGDQPTATDLATDGEGYVSGRAVAGDAVQLATTLGTLGLGTGAATTGKLTAAAPTSVLQRIGLGAKAGAGFGAAEATENAQSAEEAVKDIATGTVTGAAVSGAVEGVTTGAKKLLGKTAEELYNRIIKTPIKQTAAGREQIGEGLMKRGVKGNFEGMIKEVNTIAKSNKDKLDDVITSNAKTAVDITPVKTALKGLRTQLRGTPGETTTAVDRVLKEFGKSSTIPLEQAQKLKQNLQAAVNEAFLKNTTSGITQAQKVAAQNLRKVIEQAVPEVAPLNKELEFSIRAINQLVRQAGHSPSKLRIWAELGLGTYGILGNPVVIAGLIGGRIVTSPGSATRIGQSAFKASKLKLPNEVAQLLQRLGLLGSKE